MLLANETNSAKGVMHGQAHDSASSRAYRRHRSNRTKLHKAWLVGCGTGADRLETYYEIEEADLERFANEQNIPLIPVDSE